MNLAGKVCVITGASSGIGKSLATKLSLKGAIVVLAARRNSKLIQIKEKIENDGGTCTGIKTDISKKLECKNLLPLNFLFWKQNNHQVKVMFVLATRNLFLATVLLHSTTLIRSNG